MDGAQATARGSGRVLQPEARWGAEALGPDTDSGAKDCWLLLRDFLKQRPGC